MSRDTFTAIRTEGGLVPREMLERISAGDPDLPGSRQQDYHLPPRERLGEAINRSWNRLLGLWESYSEALEKRREDDPAVGLTRDRWLLPLFDELGYGRLQRSTAVDIEGKSFAISHTWYRTPIHLVGAGVSIDRRTAGVAGAATAAPHSLTQEFLNRSDEHLWAFVSNGRILRILRDNYSLSRQAFVEFDLEAILEGELFSDFRVLWLVCHQSRVEAEEPEECWLETWFKLAREEGVRALDSLRGGVEKAIEALGGGFLRHPRNDSLRDALRSGELDKQDYYRELLRLVYRLIFLFVAEDREVLLDPDAPTEAVRRYTHYYSSRRMRELAGRRRGTAHDDLWRGLRLTLSKLHAGCPELGLPALGSFLWSPEAVESIGTAELRNHDLLTALRELCYTTEDKQLLPVNWRTLGSEELGSVYESLLELHPRDVNLEAGTFVLDTSAGHERKTTGSYYTPTSLVDRLLDSALEPILEEAMRADDPEAAILDLKVCDTAAGSGHFLVAAARRIAMRLASVRTGEEEASPEAVTHALRDVVGRCVYGVDLNPLAVELCKVSLWMEALEPGKPLSFLDHHIQVGNSLLGTTPHLLREGIPNEAFKEIEGDDRKHMLKLRKRNREELKSEQIGFHTQMVAEPRERYRALEHALAELNRADDSTLAAIQAKEKRYQRLLDDASYREQRLVADAWCAAFVWRKTETGPPAITEDVFRQIQRAPDETPAKVVMEVRRLARRYGFFHFHLAFPEVFRAGQSPETDDELPGWPGGFDVVLGNPPWERIKLQEKEWFAERAPEIASAPNAAKRRKMIKALADEDPDLYEAFLEDRRQAEGESHLVRNSGGYPFCGRGDINTYSVFAETNRQIVGPNGRMGIIVPSGIATDATTQYFFQDLMEREALVSLYDFENRKGIFPGVHRSYKFCLLTVAGAAHEHDGGAEFAFFLHSTKDLDDDERRFLLSKEDIALLNPNTKTCPIFRTRRDAEIALSVYRQVPVFGYATSPSTFHWCASIPQGLFHQTNDSALLLDPKDIPAIDLADDNPHNMEFTHLGKPYCRLYEGRLIGHFNHRASQVHVGTDRRFRSGVGEAVSSAQLADPSFFAAPRYWVPKDEVENRIPGAYAWKWFLAFKDVTSATNERTLIAAIIPRVGVVYSARLALINGQEPKIAACLAANWNSFCFDYFCRLSTAGNHITDYIIRQLPTLTPDTYLQHIGKTGTTLASWILPRVLELSFTAWDLQHFAQDCGYAGAPFTWNEHRRFLMRCELDALFFHLYKIKPLEVDYIMETFPIVKRRDKAAHNRYRTKAVIISIYEEMAIAAANGANYQTRVDPPPANPAVAHG